MKNHRSNFEFLYMIRHPRFNWICFEHCRLLFSFGSSRALSQCHLPFTQKLVGCMQHTTKQFSLVLWRKTFYWSNRLSKIIDFSFSVISYLGFTQFPRIWSNVYLAPCTVFIYLIILAMLCYWNYSICYVLFNREALLRDNTIVTRYRRQVAKLLIAIIISFFILIFPYKIWGVIQSQLTLDQFHQIGFRVHSLILVIGRCLLYLNSAVRKCLMFLFERGKSGGNVSDFVFS